MLKKILNLKGVVQLNREQQKSINGGAGHYSIKCNSGVWIHNAPNADPETTSFACQNQGGYSGQFICSVVCD
ncbi:hypothetical protein [Paucihalobacter sp.]|uniref:hypothetical protein n=1 Tax=Paucihalobacter sp. TaxID=2850405 RepID=UPI003D1621FA